MGKKENNMQDISPGMVIESSLALKGQVLPHLTLSNPWIHTLHQELSVQAKSYCLQFHPLADFPTRVLVVPLVCQLTAKTVIKT